MKTKIIICFVVLVSVFIIERENNFISKVSDKLLMKPRTPPEAGGHWMNVRQNGSIMTVSYPSEPFRRNFTWKSKSMHKPGKGELPASRSSGRKHILLLATTRTGSSFVGESFNQQGANVFYLFEPLWHVKQALNLQDVSTNYTVLSTAYREVLQQLLLCDFSLLESFMKPQPQDHVAAFLFCRECSRSLCENPVCTPYVKEVVENFHCRNRRCAPLNLTLTSQYCLQTQYTAIKSVRVQKLETLRPLVEDPRLDMRFIQLVRDPRAMLASRMVAFPSEYKNWRIWAKTSTIPDDDNNYEIRKLKEHCDNIRMSAETGLECPAWLYGRYMLVRYEDVARFPMRKAAEIYQFTGIPFHSRVKDWILNNTHSTSEFDSIYSTKKNSSQQMDKWRVTMSFKLAQVVQKVCSPAMTLFGYKFVENEATLRNLSVSLTEERTFL
ncbi:carbohydrate sulfotransferase 3-like [Hoplias malabaricus]|uniref:carbohydrate sulfotransferase 3-like n=1 Tax=Hoplias malabaricus TaxID=27720 RepID=UPI0034632CF2